MKVEVPSEHMVDVRASKAHVDQLDVQLTQLGLELLNLLLIPGFYPLVLVVAYRAVLLAPGSF